MTVEEMKEVARLQEKNSQLRRATFPLGFLLVHYRYSLPIGEVVLQLPARVPPDELEDLRKWFELVIRGIERRAAAATAEEAVGP
jgi:hypothetical protein